MDLMDACHSSGIRLSSSFLLRKILRRLLNRDFHWYTTYLALLLVPSKQKNRWAIFRPDKKMFSMFLFLVCCAFSDDGISQCTLGKWNVENGKSLSSYIYRINFMWCICYAFEFPLKVYRKSILNVFPYLSQKCGIQY